MNQSRDSLLIVVFCYTRFANLPGKNRLPVLFSPVFWIHSSWKITRW